MTPAHTPMTANLTQGELEWRLLYSIIVAGKTEKHATAAMGRLLAREGGSPFAKIRTLDRRGELSTWLRDARVGNYTKTAKAFRELVAADIDLSTCKPDELEAIHGIGPKTARFFILWTRPDARYAALDTHVLKWLRSLGRVTPSSTPQSGSTYARLERAFIDEADAREMTPRELDYAVWAHYARGEALPKKVEVNHV